MRSRRQARIARQRRRDATEKRVRPFIVGLTIAERRERWMVLHGRAAGTPEVRAREREQFGELSVDALVFLQTTDPKLACAIWLRAAVAVERGIDWKINGIVRPFAQQLRQGREPDWRKLATAPIAGSIHRHLAELEMGVFNR